MSEITRVEVIGRDGREFSKLLSDATYEISIQDNGKTIKLFEKPNRQTWTCDQCKEETEQQIGCSSKYTSGSYCCEYCASLADLSKMLKDKK